MSLISLLIALAAERYLSSPAWQFNSFYNGYINLIKQMNITDSLWKSPLSTLVFIAVPVVGSYFLLGLVDDSFLHIIISTLILIVCFGCVNTRERYKQYLMSALRGEATTCELHHAQLLQDKNIEQMGFGQVLVWLNYRYFIAIMIFFVLFGAPGALFYRLLTRISEIKVSEDSKEENGVDEGRVGEDKVEKINEDVIEQIRLWLSWVDWIPVRIVAFGYMLVGHFSKAMPVWLESIFEFNKVPHQVLIDVAEKSEDFMVDKEDCTSEACLLVQLAKKALLLWLSVIALLVIMGVLQ
ncbi:MAG: beta-lactamase regulator AmpE [Alteromonadaceae bacterium]|nr:beta-lactamase regulator AmpE [Alteromonadaceae bacterium]